jgi:hypothetical protein
MMKSNGTDDLFPPPVLQFVYFYFRAIDDAPLDDISARLGFPPTPQERNAHFASLEQLSSVHETVEDVGTTLMIEFHDRLARFVENNLSPHRERIRAFTSRDPEIRPKLLMIFAQLDCSWDFSWTLDTKLMSELSYLGCELEVILFHSRNVDTFGASQ